MEGNGRGAATDALRICLPAELRLHILSLLPPNDLALGGRLSSKDAAQHFSELNCRTAHLRQTLPDHAVTAGQASAQTALRQLTFRQKLHLPATAAASGCEANVEFALQLLQPHVFLELLRTDGGYTWAHSGAPSREGGENLPPTADLGSAAVASGLAHLLPSLEQRCPGLLDPGRTLEAAARYCDLAGLQAAGEVLGRRLLSSIWEKVLAERAKHSETKAKDLAEANGVWQRIMVEVAGSSTPDALAKMALVLEKSNKYSRAGRGVLDAEVWGAAAASGDLARLRWLRCYRVSWQSPGALEAALHRAGVDFLQEMEQQGHLPPASQGGVWGSREMDRVAAGSPRDSAAKLLWLEARGALVGQPDAVVWAAGTGNLEALQLLLDRRLRVHQQPAEDEYKMDLLDAASYGGHVPTAAWLLQAGWPLTPDCIESAIFRGNLPMVRWLVEAGCPRGELNVSDVVDNWPCRTAVDSWQLVEVLRLVAAAGWPSHEGEAPPPLDAAVMGNKPWPVWCVLRELLPSHPDRHRDGYGLPEYHVTYAARTGCEAVLEALVREGNRGAIEWYTEAAGAGDRGTLEYVRGLGVPLEEGVLSEAVWSSAPLAALRWLAEQGGPVGEGEVQRALGAVPRCYSRKQDRREIKAWLRGLQGRFGGGVP